MKIVQPTVGLAFALIACQALSHESEGGLDRRQRCSITDFGAVGDGKFMNTVGIQRAVDTAYGHGGGTVIVPEGVFLSGTIELKSGVELRVLKGATLLGSTNPLDYVRTSGHPGLIVADNAMNVSITGEGSIDGQGLQLALTIDSLYGLGQFADPNYTHARMRPSEAVRPYILGFSHCSDVVVRTVTIRNGAGWVQVYTQCNRVGIDSIAVESTAYWNNDGIDICDCKNVTISNCTVNAADDGICLKSISPDSFNDSVSISHCTIRSSASAVKLGTDSRGGFRNITVNHIAVYDTYRSAIAIECVDGGMVDNVEVSDLQARNTGNAVFIRLGHRNPDRRVGTLRNIIIKNVKVDIPFGRPDIAYDVRGPDLSFSHNPFPASITGIPDRDVENVTLKNIEITYPGRGSKGMAYLPLSRLSQVPEMENAYPEYSMFGELPAWGLYVRHVDGLNIQEMTLRVRESDYRTACVLDDVDHMNIASSDIQTLDSDPAIVLSNVRKGNIGDVKVNGRRDHIILKLGTCESVEEE